MSRYWVCDAMGRVLGPVGLEALWHLVLTGRLRGVTQASWDGRTFLRLEAFPELSALLEEALHVHQVEQEGQEARRLLAQLEALRDKPAHAVFGLPAEASLELLRAAFFSRVKHFHPARLPRETSDELRQARGAMFEFLSRLMARCEQREPTYSPEEFAGGERRSPIA